MDQLDVILDRASREALRNNIMNIYRTAIQNIHSPVRNHRTVYYNTPPLGGYILNEEHEYVDHDNDDISSILLLDIVTSFGSPGSDNLQKQIKNQRNNQIKKIGKYKKIKNGDHLCDVETCPICIDQFKEGEYYRLLHCKHTFHKKCIDQWFKKDHFDCPMCRTKIF